MNVNFGAHGIFHLAPPTKRVGQKGTSREVSISRGDPRPAGANRTSKGLMMLLALWADRAADLEPTTYFVIVVIILGR